MSEGSSRCPAATVCVCERERAVRNNEIFLMSQHRPMRGMQESDGWSPESVIDHAFPALSTMFYPLDRSQDIFSWDPV